MHFLKRSISIADSERLSESNRNSIRISQGPQHEKGF